MGAFYICRQNIDTVEDVFQIFSKKGFDEPTVINTNGLTLLLYKKQLVDSINIVKQGGCTLYASGSCFYKGYNYEEGLKTILSDYIKDEFDSDKLIGSYFLLFCSNKTYRFYSDRAGIQSIYYHPDSGIISSSFLACLAGAAQYSGRLKLNKKTLTEVLITGNLIGPDTLVEGVFRYEPSICRDLPGIERLNLVKQKMPVEALKPRTFEAEVNNQLAILKNYFSALKPVLEEMGVLTGLTGGFDSRLLLLFLRKETNNYRIYSTYRSSASNELLCARELTKAINESLYSPKHSAYKEISTNQFTQMLINNYYFNDGLIRVFQLWTEEIKSKAYLEDLYGGFKLGLSGVGGEQYRNYDYLVKNSYLFDKWFFYEAIYRHCQDPFRSSSEKEEWLNYVKGKIYALLKKDLEEEHITRFEIKRYYNEIYNPANRTVRNNIENQLCFFLSPFTDYNVSKTAYDAFSHLGWSHAFEKEMIRQLAPDLSHIKLDYGYSTRDRVPIKFTVMALLKAIFGIEKYFRLQGLLKNKVNFLEDYCITHEPLKYYTEIIDSLGLPIKLAEIKGSNRQVPLIIEAGVFIDEVKKYVSYG